MTVAPVRLKLAKRGTVGGFTVSYCSISVKVQNLGFAKDVVAVYTPDGQVWKEHPLHFTRRYGSYGRVRAHHLPRASAAVCGALPCGRADLLRQQRRVRLPPRSGRTAPSAAALVCAVVGICRSRPAPCAESGSMRRAVRWTGAGALVRDRVLDGVASSRTATLAGLRGRCEVCRCSLETSRRLVAQPGVQPLSIVEDFDVFGNSPARFRPRGKDGTVNEFVLQRGKERFGQGIIQHTPVLPMDAVMLWAARCSANCVLVNCVPLSE